mmetsp:Transcript_45560/g.81501  ORF Transcript_45560/g.81501 Transcript_45560/m.81501 type:complete len:92 (-) Transcript_45560:797-1072(-)
MGGAPSQTVVRGMMMPHILTLNAPSTDQEWCAILHLEPNGCIVTALTILWSTSKEQSAKAKVNCILYFVAVCLIFSWAFCIPPQHIKQEGL